jgi:hypothetical protein
MKKVLLSAVMVVGVLWAVPAQASLILAGTIGGVNFCATDNNTACGFGLQLTDVNAAVGQLSLNPATIGGLLIEGSLQQAIIGGTNVLNSSSLQISNSSGATVAASLAVSGTNFAGPATQSFFSGSGVWENALGSSMTMSWYNDPANAQGATTPANRPGVLLGTFTDVANTPADSFSTNGSAPLIDPALFSMTLGFNLSLISGTAALPARLVNRGQTEIVPQVVGGSNPVPEPTSILLLGSGLAIVARRIRKGRQ